MAAAAAEGEGVEGVEGEEEGSDDTIFSILACSFQPDHILFDFSTSATVSIKHLLSEALSPAIFSIMESTIPLSFSPFSKRAFTRAAPIVLESLVTTELNSDGVNTQVSSLRDNDLSAVDEDDKLVAAVVRRAESGIGCWLDIVKIGFKRLPRIYQPCLRGCFEGEGDNFSACEYIS
jgi:hypothetical protein